MQLLKELVPSLLRKYSRASVKAFFGTKISEKPHYCEDTLNQEAQKHLQYTKLKLLTSCK